MGKTSTIALHGQQTGITSISVHLGAAAVTALMLGLSFPPPGLWWLAYIALVPLGVVAVRSAKPWRLIWTTYIVSLVWWLVMLRWLVPVTGGGYVALCAYMAVYLPAAAALWRLLRKRQQVMATLALPMVWVTLEMVRGHILAGGFGWFALGHSQAAWQPGSAPGRIVQIADTFGELGVSFVVAMTSGLIVDLLTQPLRKPGKAGKHRWRRRIVAVTCTWLTITLGAFAYGEFRIRQFENVTTAGPRIAVIQTNVPQDNKNRRTAEQDAQDFTAMVSLTNQVSQEVPRPDLIVWPETMVPAPLNPEALVHYGQIGGDGSYHEVISLIARELTIPLMVGSHAYFDWQMFESPDGHLYEVPTRRYNSVYLYEADGVQSAVRYDKIHRVPFGEYLPWIGRWPWLKGLFLKYLSPYPYDYSLTAGDRVATFEIPMQQATQEQDGQMHYVAATPICFEDAVARVTRRLVYEDAGQKRADMLINLTNSAWYPDSHQQVQHLQIAVLRAIENRVPIARSVNYGISGFIDSVGRITTVVSENGKQLDVSGSAAATMRIDQRVTVWGRFGEVPIMLLAAATGLLILGGLIQAGKIGLRPR